MTSIASFDNHPIDGKNTPIKKQELSLFIYDLILHVLIFNIKHVENLL